LLFRIDVAVPVYHWVGQGGILANDIYLIVEGILALVALFFLETSLHKLAGHWERYLLRRKTKNKILPKSEAMEDQLYLESTTMEADAKDYQVFIR